MRTMRSAKAVVLAAFAFSVVVPVAQAEDPNPPSIRSSRGAWPICRQWNVAETRYFAEWIENIYRVKSEGTLEQRLAKLEAVLTDPETNLLEKPEFLGESGNPQLELGTIRSLHGVVDCANWP